MQGWHLTGGNCRSVRQVALLLRRTWLSVIRINGISSLTGWLMSWSVWRKHSRSTSDFSGKVVCMRGSAKVIKFTTAMSILFLALTYFTTVNIEAHIIERYGFQIILLLQYLEGHLQVCLWFWFVRYKNILPPRHLWRNTYSIRLFSCVMHYFWYNKIFSIIKKMQRLVFQIIFWMKRQEWYKARFMLCRVLIMRHLVKKIFCW